MPRLFIRRKDPLTTDERITRASRYRVYRAGEWIDPFPEIVGTRPEKMVYAELSKRQIPFIYQSFIRFNIPEFSFDKWYRPDFVIPDAKIIIEVQGFYWHSQPDQIEKDAFRFAIFQQQGYKVLAWWDFEIESDLQRLMASDPALLRLSGRGGRIYTGNERIIDDSAGIRSANQARTDYGRRRAVYSVARKSPRSIYSYDTR